MAGTFAKIVRACGDEANAAAALVAFGGRGMVRLVDRADATLILERLTPGTPLSRLAARDDDAATVVIADVIRRMQPDPSTHTFPTVEDWGGSFEVYLGGASADLPRELVLYAHQTYVELCASQGARRLLHGDLHHDNVLFDESRGWTAIDPKGVLGEVAYETGAALRNPWNRPDIFASEARIRCRVERLARELDLDATRILRWSLSQAVLALIWLIEDGEAVERHHPWLRLAAALEPMCRAPGGVW
jgi:streptomycin 6-kinase